MINVLWELEALFFETESPLSHYPHIHNDIILLAGVSDWAILDSPIGNFVYPIYSSLFSAITCEKENKQAITSLLSTIIGGMWDGPPPYFLSYLCLFSQKKSLLQFSVANTTSRVRDRILDRDRPQNQDQIIRKKKEGKK